MCAQRIEGFNKPTIWTKMANLAIAQKAVNLGQGFPSWGPPEFFKENLLNAQKEGMNFQYSRAYGDLELVSVAAEFYSEVLGQNIDALNNICITEGACSALFCSILGLVNPGEDAVVIEPAYDCYMGQVQMAGGNYIGVPMIPPKPLNREELKGRFSADGEFKYNRETDSFKIDFDLLKSKLTANTKVLILNSPHNPTGKIFTRDEYKQIAEILKDYPQIIVLADEVYEFNLYEDIQTLPRFATIEGMYERTISIYSAGKTFSATGIRIGFAIGPAKLVEAVKAVHQYSSFCLYKPLQLAVAQSYKDHILNKTSPYKQDLINKYKSNRNLLMKELSESSFDFKFYIPESGYFLVLDIDGIDYDLKHLNEGETNDIGFTTYLAIEKKVVLIPLSVFYSKETKAYGKNYVRAAFCKTADMIKDGGNNLK